MLNLGRKFVEVMKKSRNRKKIMLRCTRLNTVLYKEEGLEDKTGQVFNCYDFYVVDLKGDVVLTSYCPPLLGDFMGHDFMGPGNFICLGSFMYSIPLLLDVDYGNIPPSLPYPNTGELVDIHSQMLFSTFDESQNPKNWTPISCVVPRDFRCAALSGVIYGLESGRINNALCFEPCRNCWSPSNAPPPSHLHECLVTGRMIPDPVNDRILVHLVGGSLNQPCLYEWKPKINSNGEPWRLLQPFNPDLWIEVSTLMNIDNKSLLFFFFPVITEPFKVWSLQDNNFLEICWWNEFPCLNFSAVQSHSMCYLGKNQLCSALSFPPVGFKHTPVAFLIFDIKLLSRRDMKSKGKEVGVKSRRKELTVKIRGKELGVKSEGKDPASDASADYIIAFTHVASKSFQALDTRCVLDITPLGNVDNSNNFIR